MHIIVVLYNHLYLVEFLACDIHFKLFNHYSSLRNCACSKRDVFEIETRYYCSKKYL